MATIDSIEKLSEILITLEAKNDQPVLQEILKGEIKTRTSINKTNPGDLYYLRTYFAPNLVFMKNGETQLVIPQHRYAHKFLYFVQPTGLFNVQEMTLIDSADFKERVLDTIQLEDIDFQNLLKEQNNLYTNSCIHGKPIEGEIPRVLRLRNKYYLEQVMNNINDPEKNMFQSIANIFEDTNKFLHDERTEFFVLSNVDYYPFASAGNYIKNREHQDLVGIIFNKPVDLNHVRALFIDGCKNMSSIIREISMNLHSQSTPSEIYPIPMAADKAINLLKQSSPRYEMSLNIKKID